MIDRTGLFTCSVFKRQGDKIKIVYKCRLHDKPQRKHCKGGSAADGSAADGSATSGSPADGSAAGGSAADISAADGSTDGSALPHKTTLFTQRKNTTSHMCDCKAKIFVLIRNNVAHLRMHLCHTGHTPNTPADLHALPLRHEVVAELYAVSKITRSYPSMRRHIRLWVVDSLKPALGLPKEMITEKKSEGEEKGGKKITRKKKKKQKRQTYLDRRFNPTDDDIHNVLQGRARENRLSKVDQEDTLKQLCTDEDLAWAFRPHVGGHAYVMYLPKQGLYTLGTRSDLTMDIRRATKDWNEEIFQDALSGFLKSRIESANQTVSDICKCNPNCKDTTLYSTPANIMKNESTCLRVSHCNSSSL